MTILDLKPGNACEMKAIIKKVTIGKNANTRNAYLNLTLSDAYDQVEAKYWNVDEKIIEAFQLGSLIEFKGEVINYNGQRQVKIINAYVIEASIEEKSKYIFKAPRDLKEMKQELKEVLDSIKDEALNQVTKYIIDKHYSAYITHSAAKTNHHDYYSGLLYHSLNMVKIAKSLHLIYPYIDIDLLICGCLLHDIGKVEELASPISPNYTVKGNLLGHITIGTIYVEEAKHALQIDSEKIMLLEHLILSHHGKLEYGSPVKPMILEAELLTYIDNMDSRIEIFNKNLKGVEKGSFTNRIFALDDRQIYKKK